MPFPKRARMTAALLTLAEGALPRRRPSEFAALRLAPASPDGASRKEGD